MPSAQSPAGTPLLCSTSAQMALKPAHAGNLSGVATDCKGRPATSLHPCLCMPLCVTGAAGTIGSIGLQLWEGSNGIVIGDGMFPHQERGVIRAVGVDTDCGSRESNDQNRGTAPTERGGPSGP